MSLEDLLPMSSDHTTQWQRNGYRVKLYFLKLPDPEFAIRRVEQRVRLGGHDIPVATIRRRFARGWENLRKHYLGIVDEWAIYDGSSQPPVLLETGENHPPQKLMEDSNPYQSPETRARPVQPLNDPDFIGAEAALKRASAKAIERARAAGLEPVVALPRETPTKR